MDGVVFQHAGVGVGAGNGLVGVVLVDGLLGADARQDALPAPGEARKEVGINETLGNEQVAFRGQLVHVEIRSGGESADVGELGGVKGVVDGDFLVVHDGIAKHPPLFFLGGGTMEARGDEDGDVRIRIAGADLLQQDGQGQLAGHGPGVVAGDQNDFVLALGQLPEPGGADGMLQGLPDEFHFALAGVIFVHFRSDHLQEVLFLHVKVQRRRIIRNLNGLHRKPPLLCGGETGRFTRQDCMQSTLRHYHSAIVVKCQGKKQKNKI